MALAKDKILHVAFGAGSALAAVLIVEVAHRFGLSWAMLLAAAMIGVGYELQQKLRGNGQPSWADALATSAGGAGVAAALAIYAAAPWA